MARVLEPTEGVPPLDIIAIPNLPSLLSRDSSLAFSCQLLPHLLELPTKGWEAPVWKRCLDAFEKAVYPLRVVPMPATLRSASNLTPAQSHVMRCLASGIQVSEIAPLHTIRVQFSNSNLQTKNFTKKFKKCVGQVLKLHSILHARLDLVSQQLIEGDVLDMEKYVIAAESDDSQKVVGTARRRMDELDPTKGQNLAIIISVHRDGRSATIACTMHPLVGDHLSVRMFLHQLLVAYESGIFSFTPPRIQHADYGNWLQQLNRSALGDLTLQFWRELLDDSAPVLQPPTDFSRPRTVSRKHLMRTLELTSEQNEAVKNLCASLSGVASPSWVLYSIFMTAYVIVLYRRTREADIVVSSILSGRPIEGLRGVVGPLCSQTHYRFVVDEDKNFVQTFEHVLEGVRAVVSHQDLPYHSITNKLSEIKGASDRFKTVESHTLSSAFSQTMFSMSPGLMASDDPAGILPLPEGIAVSDVPIVESFSPQDLGLLVSTKTYPAAEENKDFVLIMDYNPQLLEAESIDAFLEQIGLLLEQAGSLPEQMIMKYNLVTPRALHILPDPTAPIDNGWPGPITACFDSVASKYPSRVAVSYQAEEVSYDKLRKMTNKLACALHAAGLKNGDCVGLYGHRSPAVVWAIMGVLKAGCAYCMIDPKYPADRIVTCLEIAGVRGWIEIEAAGVPAKEVRHYLDSNNMKFRCSLPPTDTEVDHFPEHSGELGPGVQISKDDIAVITFTSGSTGLPKGVMGRHAPLTTYYDWMAGRFGISSDDKFSMCSGIAHDPLQRDIFTPLYFGASVAIPTDDDIAEPGALAKWFKQHRITIACMTPAMGQLLTSDENTSFTLDDFRTSFFVGDMLIKKNVLQLRELAPKLSVINMYGSTETQRSVGYLEVRPDTDQLEKAKEVIAVGVGMKDAQLLCINTAGLIAGIGEMAEIYVRSPHIARGYIGLEEKSKSVFVQNPFNRGGMDREVDRMYRTGDLGRYTVSGDVECCGRADDQIKIRGFRIELGEINGFLSKHPYVKENVTLTSIVDGQKEILSFVVPSEKAIKQGSDKVDAFQVGQDLRNYLKEHLPHYMVPMVITVIASMPLTPNGKINRTVLAEMDVKRTTKGSGHGELQRVLTPIEQTLLKVWSKLLKVESLGVNDNFFDMGGNSLLATRLTLDMRKALPEDASKYLDISMLLKYPTIEQVSNIYADWLRSPTSMNVPRVNSPNVCSCAYMCIFKGGGRVAREGER